MMNPRTRAPSALSGSGVGEQVIVWRDGAEIRVLSRLDAEAAKLTTEEGILT